MADALYDRDRLEQVDWDIDLWLEMVETPNFYKSIELPTFDKKAESYISYIPARWRVSRKIDGKRVYFGTYKSREEAEARVFELQENGWQK